MAENNILWWDGSEESAKKAYQGHPKMSEAFGSFENYLEYLNAYNDLIESVRNEVGELLDNSAEYQAVVDAGGLLQYAGQMAASGEEFTGVDYLTDTQNLWKEKQDALLEQYAPGFSFDTFEESDGDKWSWNGSQWVRYEKGSDPGWDAFSDVLSAAGYAFIGSGVGGALGGGLTGSGGAGLEAALPTLGATTGSTVGAGAGAGLGLFAPTSGSSPGVATGTYGIDDPSQFTQMLVDMFGPGIGGTGSLQNWEDFAKGILTGDLDLIKNSISVLVPSIPTGLPLPPSMMVLGTIGQILENPGALATSKINQLLDVFVTRDPSTGKITGIKSPEDLLGSLGGFIQGAYEDMPPDQIPPIILAGIIAKEYGQDVYDWVKDKFGYGDQSVESFEEFLQDNNVLPFSGEEEEEEEDKTGSAVPEEAESFDRTEQVADLLGDMTSIFGDTIPDAESELEDVRDEQIQESVLDLLGGARGSVDSDMSQEDPLAGVEDDTENGFTFGGESSVPQDELTEEEKQEAIAYLTGQLEEKVGDSENGFTFGGESFVPQDKLTEEEKQEAIAYLTDQLEEKVGDPDDVVSDLTSETVLDDPATKPEEVLSGEDSSTGGGGGGAGSVSTQSEDFTRGLSYTPLQIAPIPARPLVDYTAGLFTQPTSRMSGLQLGGITAGLFGDMIG